MKGTSIITFYEWILRTFRTRDKHFSDPLSVYFTCVMGSTRDCLTLTINTEYKHIWNHIFQNTWGTWNIMVHKKKRNFLAQFAMPFHLVWLVSLRVIAQKTTFWTVESHRQPIRGFYSMVFEANTCNETDHTMWKGMENCARHRCLSCRA